MSLSPEELRQVAHLARLQLGPDELPRFQSGLNAILSMIDQMQQTPTAAIIPMAHPFDLAQPLRPDCVTETDLRPLVMALAPATQEGLYLVPKVIE